MNERFRGRVISRIEDDLPTIKISRARRYFEDTKGLLASPSDFDGARYQDTISASAVSYLVLSPFLIPTAITTRSIEGVGRLRRRKATRKAAKHLKELIAGLRASRQKTGVAGGAISPYRGAAGPILDTATPEVISLLTSSDHGFVVRYTCAERRDVGPDLIFEGLFLCLQKEESFELLSHLFSEGRKRKIDALERKLGDALDMAIPSGLKSERWSWCRGEPTTLSAAT